MSPHQDKKFSCEITQAKDLGGGYFLLTFVAPEEFSHRPGQYVRLIFTDQQGDFERFYSVANAPNEQNEVQFCIQLGEPRVAAVLKSMQLGGKQVISEASGRFELLNPNKPVILIAGGSGISPIRSFFQQLTGGFTQEPASRLHLVYGCKHGAYVPGKEEFLDYAHNFPDKVKVWIVVEEESEPQLFRGQVTSVLHEAVLPSGQYYVCGPGAMIDAVRHELGKLGVAQSDILQDPY